MNWVKRHKIWSIIIALVIIGIIGAAGSSSKDNKTSQPAADNNPNSSQPQDKTKKLGDAVRDGKFEFVIKKLKCNVPTVGSGFSTDHAQGQYCLVTMTVKNIGDEAQTFDATNQYLLKGSTKYSASSSASFDANTEHSTFLEQINPGNTVTGIVVFDLPKGVTPTTAELHDSAFSGGVKVEL